MVWSKLFNDVNLCNYSIKEINNKVIYLKLRKIWMIVQMLFLIIYLQVFKICFIFYDK